MATDIQPEPIFTIGAVSRLTGIPVDTLRVWERRYGGTAPARTATNRRRYTRRDVVRLGLIKQLVDLGHSVGTVIHLPEADLRERLGLHEERVVPSEEPAEKPSVLVYGEVLPFLVENWTDDLGGVELMGRHTGYAEFESDALERQPAILVAEWPVLQPESMLRLHDLAQRVAARRVVVVYGFAAKGALEQARRLGMVVLRSPLTGPALEAACLGAESSPVPTLPDPSAEVPARLFDNETLGRLANMATRLRCECPHHLADLVFRLSAFETYSLDCENRDSRDAALHAHLYRTTAQARALIEAALAHLIEVEGIDPTEPPSPEQTPASLPG